MKIKDCGKAHNHTVCGHCEALDLLRQKYKLIEFLKEQKDKPTYYANGGYYYEQIFCKIKELDNDNSALLNYDENEFDYVPKKPYFKYKDIAEILDVSSRFVGYLVEKGKLKKVVLDGRKSAKVTRKSFILYLQKIEAQND